MRSLHIVKLIVEDETGEVEVSQVVQDRLCLSWQTALTSGFNFEEPVKDFKLVT